MTTSLERLETTLQHREPDRPPVFLLATMHGAKALGLTLERYFSSAEHLVEGQLRLRQALGHDCLLAFFHSSLEVEAWGGRTRYVEDGPPNVEAPVLRRAEAIATLEAPAVDAPPLRRVLEAIRLLRERGRGEVPVLAVVLSPFSSPVLQLGFGPYLDLLQDATEAPGSDRARLLERLLRLNLDFAVRWGNAQLAAGATALVYADPLSSCTMTSAALGEGVGLPLASRAFKALKGPVGLHFASGRILPRLEAAIATGAALLGVSAEEDLAELKRRCRGRVTLAGNLNGIQMVRWTPAQAALQAEATLEAGAPGGGFILCDNHGEIPFQVPLEVLRALVDATEAWARRRRSHR